MVVFCRALLLPNRVVCVRPMELIQQLRGDEARHEAVRYQTDQAGSTPRRRVVPYHPTSNPSSLWLSRPISGSLSLSSCSLLSVGWCVFITGGTPAVVTGEPAFADEQAWKKTTARSAYGLWRIPREAQSTSFSAELSRTPREEEEATSTVRECRSSSRENRGWYTAAVFPSLSRLYPAWPTYVSVQTRVSLQLASSAEVSTHRSLCGKVVRSMARAVL